MDHSEYADLITVSSQSEGRLEWEFARERVHAWGASQASKLLSTARDGSLSKSFHKLIEDWLLPGKPLMEISADVRRGRFLEAGVLEWASLVHQVNFQGGAGLWLSKRCQWLCATPDAYLNGELVEVKCSTLSCVGCWRRAEFYRQVKSEIDDESKAALRPVQHSCEKCKSRVLSTYKSQLIHQAFVCGLEGQDFHVLLWGFDVSSDPVLFSFPWLPEYDTTIEKLKERAETAAELVGWKN